MCSNRSSAADVPECLLCKAADAEEARKLATWRTQAVQKIYMVNWRRQPDDVLRQVLNLIEAADAT
jgi:hypothetical protein